ncbi:MAG: hypothetical protein MUE49_10730 [Rhodospirillales bacterium]|nr:hypothetical protein [Rhodospirillales bacterium]
MNDDHAINNTSESGQRPTLLRVSAWWVEHNLSAYTNCLGCVDAVLKSQEIVWRGVRVWQAALDGTVHTVLHETFADLRTRLSCQSLGSLLALERDLVAISVSRLTDRAAFLGRMVVQTVEDASEPLWRRCTLGLDAASGYGR